MERHLHVRWRKILEACVVMAVLVSADLSTDDVLVRLTGWDLQDECLFHNCHHEASCIPKSGGFSCACKAGWDGDGWDCQNVNECEENWNVCGENTHCNDTIGSFLCSCKEGFVDIAPRSEAVEAASNNLHRPVCQDINECAAANTTKCHPLAICENTEGSFRCQCPRGFFGDGVSLCADECTPASPAQRIDCFPDGDATEVICMRRGCCWQPYERANAGQADGQRVKDVVPPCYYPLPANTYELLDVEESDHGLSGTLSCSSRMRSGDGSGGNGNRPYHIGPFGSEICPLKIQVTFESVDHLRLQIKDAAHDRWEVPEHLFPPRVDKQKVPVQNRKYVVKYTQIPFGLAIVRAETGEVLFNSTPVVGKINGLAFEEQYLEFSTMLQRDPLLYGFGEQNAPLKLPTGQVHGVDVYTIFARDQFTPAHRAAGGTGLYGAHPFCMQISKESGHAHALFLRNSNGMDVLLTPESMTLRLIGGIVDVSFFLGPSPKDVLRQYTAIIGRPSLPPVWALGFHLCRWGYESLEAVQAVVESMWAHDVPHDVQWSDIDYMDGFRDFTLDPVRYPSQAFREFVRKLHDRGQRYVTIVDPGISVHNRNDSSYSPYEDGVAKAVFVHDQSGTPVEGSVWPGAVVFPDFGHPNASDYWTRQIAAFHEQLPVDGLWLDMNEPSNFCDGACSLRRWGCQAWESKSAAEEGVRGRRHGACSGGRVEVVAADAGEEAQAERLRVVFAPWKLRSKRGRRFDPAHPPYIPGGGASLDTRTLPMTARHCWALGGGEAQGMAGSGERCTEVLHYDVHNLYGLTEMRVSARALERIRGERSLIISRSTFAGSGRSGGHWLGDNKSSWADLRASIAGILAFGLFGVPLVGADVCGFQGDASRELCIRWTQAGAWYPFSRNHNEIGRRAQEPVAFDAEATAMMRHALRTRYRLLPYLYTAFFTAHTDGTPVARPVWMEELGAAVAGAAAGIDDEFFVGGALLVAPVLESGQRSRRAYLPPGPWFDLLSGAPLLPPPPASHAPPPLDGSWVELDAPLWHVPVYLRGGHVVPTQRAARTTAAVRRTPVTLLAAPDAAGRAAGRLVLDDGVGLDTAARGAYTLVHLAAFVERIAMRGNLTASPTVLGYDPAADPAVGRAIEYEEVRIMGVPLPPPGAGDYRVLLNSRRLAPHAVAMDALRGMLRVRLDGGRIAAAADLEELAAWRASPPPDSTPADAPAAARDLPPGPTLAAPRSPGPDSPDVGQPLAGHDDRPRQDLPRGGPSVLEHVTLEWLLDPADVATASRRRE